MSRQRLSATLHGCSTALQIQTSDDELLRAAARGDEVRVQQLLAEGVNVNAADGDGWTALHWAAGDSHTGTVQALLTAGATADARNISRFSKRTPLHYAALNGHTGPVQALVTAGADINARDDTKRTPLHYAADKGYPECVKILLKTGANTIIRDKHKKTAEGLAAQEDVLKVFQLFKNPVVSCRVRFQDRRWSKQLNVDLQPKVVDNLLTIDLGDKELTSVPAEVFDFTDVERLVLSNNRLTSIPEEISQLQKLRELKLDNNLLTQLPQAITTLPDLHHIDLSDNKLETLPDGFSRLQLHGLDLRSNGFKEIPEEVCSLLQLNTLSVGGNPLKCLPDKISQLTGLRTIFINICQFDEFPRQVLQLEGLERLLIGNWAGFGKPSPVPEDIGRLKNLQVLDLQNSRLESLPDGVGELKQLKYLGIAGNRFTSVPKQIMNLSNVEKLNLSENRISRLPLTLSRLAGLKDMEVSGNPLTYPPPDVCEKGTTAIIDFLKEKEQGKELRKLVPRFSQNVTETREVEDLATALGLSADEITTIQALRNQTPSSQAYKVLLKWIEKDREASMDKLQQELSDFGTMDRLAEEVGRIKAQPAKRPADTSGDHRLRAQVEELQGNKKSRSRDDGPAGLQCKGAKVYSTVLSATQEDKDDAAADGVQLIFPTISERDKREPCLDWLTFDHKARYPDLPRVDFIVGHVTITSHAARQIKEQRFPDAMLVQVTHVVPEDTNQYKGDERVMSIGDEQKSILEDLKHADVIISVGPYMHDYYRRETEDFQPHYEFLPKPSDIFSTASVKYIGGVVKVVLTVGRVQGVERLKGYDLVAKAMGKVIIVLPNTKLRVRGVSAEDFQESREIIQANVEFAPFTPLKYGTQEELRKDMERASVVLMPSRAEPFGLVGLEAIAAGVPVVVSHKSGLAMFLKKQDPEFDRTIVEIEDDDEEAAKTLAKRIIKILKDGSREFQAAQSLKKKLLDSNYWAASHTQFLGTFGLEG
ncbi:LRRIQ4 [Branchiostoma lanceolatum]|uniref:Leucine-rich repeat protein SHOC-2 n=1 Tax=Branchiostoma lanceolatum TaxID=7740 RepID=A0A8K0EEE1_BRALA|nr:LRRIQ4 [Branchiostoma lanceolatum]